MSASLRARVAKGLTRIISEGNSLSEVVPDFDNLTQQDKALARELLFGTLRQHYPLEAITGRLLNKPLKTKDNDIKCLIMLGLYQLFFTRIPDHAVLSETVQASVKLKKAWAKGLINALLRKALREGDTLVNSVNTKPWIAASLPQWLYQQIEKDWPEESKQITTGSHKRAPLTLRVNHRHTSREQYLKKLQEKAINAVPHPLAEQALSLEKSCDITLLPGYLEGDFSVQDSAAQMAGQLLEVMPGQRILDACAAPGGKTTHLLELTDNKADMIAVDNSADRVERLQENLKRLQLNAKTVVADVINTSDWFDGDRFDRILCDAPCSATGIVRRHPDIAILRRESDIKPLNRIQQKILDALWPLLKPGGIMLYATCSILRSENSEQISAFLQRHKDARLEEITSGESESLEVRNAIPGWQILPGESEMDGFYYAKLHKVAI